MIDMDADPDSDPVEAICESKEVGALAHLYRAEVYRSTIWRQRLDQTMNWAVISTGIGLSVSFASPQASAFPIVLVGMLCVVFLFLEARRYRFFYVWRFRARVLEIAFFVPILQGKGANIALERGTALSDDYISPQYRISFLRCLGRRLRRNYGYIFAILGAAYVAKILLMLEASGNLTWQSFLNSAHIGPVPGALAWLAGLMFHAIWIGVTWYTWRQETADTGKMADFLVSRDDVLNGKGPKKVVDDKPVTNRG